MFDLVIKDAEIYDGAGNAPIRGDLGVTAGKITAVGGGLGAAKETVKADGLALALEAAFAGGGVHLVSTPIDYSENDHILNKEIKELSAKL